MYRINLFNADREMSNRVVEFMEKNVWSIAERKRVGDEITDLRKKHAGLKKALASALKEDVFKEMLAIEAQIAGLEAGLEKDCKDNMFKYDDADSALYKGYKEGNLVFALRDWFKQYNLIIAESNLEKDLRDALGGKMPAGAGVIVNSAGATWNRDRSRGNFFKVFYGSLAEAMIKAGTIKTVAIPENLRDAYKKPEKKTEKKAEKKNK